MRRNRSPIAAWPVGYLPMVDRQSYDRGEAEAIANVMTLRAASHEKLMGEAA